MSDDYINTQDQMKIAALEHQINELKKSPVITEQIPDYMPDWAVEAMTEGRLFERVFERINLLEEALEFCAGSNDFAYKGRARKGWLKLCAPLLA